LAATVRKRMETLRFEDAAHYFGRLTTSREEAQTLIEEVTINETYFFRNTSHFDCLRDHLFPEIVRRGQAAARREVAMWSAACSTGEEPYSLAILARQVFPRDWTIRIHASDIDSKVLRFAENGVYPRMRVARTPPAYMDIVTRHLRGADDGCAFDAEIKSLVNFKRESIFESSLRNLDLIFCRNVMIYFDQAGVARMADVFNASLRDEGVVIIGHSELLRAKPDTLHYCRVGGVSLYRRRQAARKAA
ncbi:MAG: protein-glutamate O-methyltransferase CheR, partial [Candidatus Methylomirabilis sp.]|nr:protein-glutamate O-methyltransferase CheR [Deltaproteobacteria bacterium]